MERPLTNQLSSWSWQDIIDTYRAFGKTLKEYRGLEIRCRIPRSVNIDYTDQENIFIIRFRTDVKRMDTQLGVLDQEIARRSQLIGVVG